MAIFFNFFQPEICSSSLIDLLHTVVDYSEDASFIVYGHPNLGGSDSSVTYYLPVLHYITTLSLRPDVGLVSCRAKRNTLCHGC